MYAIRSYYAFEVRIRTVIQDAWSVLDHKIKYKKSIPNDLKRRINILSALFELADREFKEIRNATTELIEMETVITSYSIHYTKLYDHPRPTGGLRRGPPGSKLVR